MTDENIIKLLGIKENEKIIDIGGSARQHTLINVDTLVDIVEPKEVAYYHEDIKVIKAKNFLKLDITKNRLPFKDKQFDVCLCTHTLEDLYNPFTVIDEMQRISKRGLILTPSMGKEFEFGKYDCTDWLTGSRRQPGNAHHYWFYYKNKKNQMVVIPKFYPILYTKEFFITKWSGPIEFEYIWKDVINYRVFNPLNIHELITIYKSFLKLNKKYVKKGRVLFYVDNPFQILKANAKRIFKLGEAYNQFKLDTVSKIDIENL